MLEAAKEKVEANRMEAGRGKEEKGGKGTGRRDRKREEDGEIREGGQGEWGEERSKEANNEMGES